MQNMASRACWCSPFQPIRVQSPGVIFDVPSENGHAGEIDDVGALTDRLEHLFGLFVRDLSNESPQTAVA